MLSGGWGGERHNPEGRDRNKENNDLLRSKYKTVTRNKSRPNRSVVRPFHAGQAEAIEKGKDRQRFGIVGAQKIARANW
jgi:hypothetical protein